MSGASKKMAGDHPRNTGPMLASRRCGGQDAFRQTVHGPGREGKSTVSDAWWRARLGRSPWQ